VVDFPLSLIDQREDLARDVALYASDGLELGVAFRNTLCNVGLGPEIGPKPADGDDVERTVGRPIASVETMADGFFQKKQVPGSRRTARRSWPRTADVPIVARRQKQLRSGPVADRVPGHEGGGELVDDGNDHGVEIYDLIVQFEVAPASDLSVIR
jgi:hypothetical protein